MAVATTQDEIIRREQFEHDHDRLVREEIETFRQRSEAFLAGEITEDQFRPFRLKHGIYGQRQSGVQMVRCKIPGGLLTVAQVEQLAVIADEFGGGKGHITTRQNVQYHFVPLRNVPALMHRLADVGLTNREACYNTVRNVTVCPWSGIARDEAFDVRPYAQKLAYAFLRKDLTSNLPRKFKFAFDGCQGRDCIAGAINDVGLRATVRDGRRGFRMVVGGGLGPMPREAQLLDEFVPEDRLMNKCEAVVRVFNRHGNRGNKNLARFKFVLRERGFAWVKEQIEQEYQDILANGGIAWPESGSGGLWRLQLESPAARRGRVASDGGTAAHAATRNMTPGSKPTWWSSGRPGYAAVVVRVDQGNLSSAQLRGLAGIAAKFGDGMARVSIDQNVVLAFVPLAACRGSMPPYAKWTWLGLARGKSRT